MRKLDEHVVNPINDRIEILVMDEPGAGNAHHHYTINLDGSSNGLDVCFQNGPISEVGINGVTNEALLAIVIDRLRCFQTGPFVCKENAAALYHAVQSLNQLRARTISRMARGVEGTHKI